MVAYVEVLIVFFFFNPSFIAISANQEGRCALPAYLCTFEMGHGFEKGRERKSVRKGDRAELKEE